MADPLMNRSLILEAPQRVADGAGGFSRTWEPLGVLWAEVKAGRGREMAQGQAVLSRVPLRITVRAAPVGAVSRPKAGQRFVEGTRVFSIHAVSDAGSHGQFLTCHALEEVAP
ncbi:head-tail adaptor protein [Yoonia litorea]|uniref:Head-tail adaptor n=1 Tax=Yoonia litorea TaxID=1123755 RepID=A0A1I6LX67_9RHOB|nr:head-tail adaptor protein [Yoonia litorea]SFS08023.1 head-tail adaptor [Yoonia litorea]